MSDDTPVVNRGADRPRGLRTVGCWKRQVAAQEAELEHLRSEVEYLDDEIQRASIYATLAAEFKYGTNCPCCMFSRPGHSDVCPLGRLFDMLVPQEGE